MQAGSVQTMQALWYKVQYSISLIHRDNNPGLHLDQLPGLLYRASLLSKVSCNMAICFNGPDSLVKQFTIVQCVLSCILVIIGTFKLLSASMLSTFRWMKSNNFFVKFRVYNISAPEHQKLDILFPTPHKTLLIMGCWDKIIKLSDQELGYF